MIAVAAPSSVSTSSIHLEAEDATLTGCQIATARAGFSGTGYVTGLDGDGDQLTWPIPAAAPGIYQMSIRHSSPLGEKGFECVVNGLSLYGTFAKTGDEFATKDVGKVELQSGANALVLKKGWGWFDVDGVSLVRVTQVPATKKVPKTLSDPQANAETRALMSRLVDLYGRRTLTGQNKLGEFSQMADIDLIKSISQEEPAIIGGDLMGYSPASVARVGMPKDYTERLIALARDGHIPAVMWHWHAPSHLIDGSYTNAEGKTVESHWWSGFYTYGSTFDLEKVLNDPNSEDYKLLLSNMDAIAVQLKKFQNAHIPVLWRPLHEAEGRWFWWGAKGPEPFKKLWRLMHDRFTKQQGLHNLIWVYTGTDNKEWYPGDDVVDIVGVETGGQEGDPLSALWEKMQSAYGGKKLLAITEAGGVPDIEKMYRFGVTWSYFMSWNEGAKAASRGMVVKTYQSPRAVNSNDVKTWFPQKPEKVTR